MMLSLLFVLSTLIALALSGNNTVNDTKIYVNPSSVCEPDNANITLNYTCDGSMELPFSTIQDALDVAHGGVVIILQKGTYTGSGNKNLEIYDGYRRIYGEHYLDTFLDCENDGFGIAFNKGTFFLSHVTIQNCVGIERRLYNLSLGNGTATPSVTNRTIGGALWIENAYAKMTYCRLDGNSAELGGAVYSYSATVDFENSIISNNEASGIGGAVFVENGYLALRESTSVYDNSAENGGGGLFIRKASVEMEGGSYLTRNEADNEEGNEVLCASGSGVLYNSAYISSSTDISASDYQAGDAVCYDTCALIDNRTNFDYCNYVPPTPAPTVSADSNDTSSGSSDSGDDDSDEATSDANGLAYASGWMLVYVTLAVVFGLN